VPPSIPGPDAIGFKSAGNRAKAGATRPHLADASQDGLLARVGLQVTSDETEPERGLAHALSAAPLCLDRCTPGPRS